VAPFLILVIGELLLLLSSSQIKRNAAISVGILALFSIIPSSYLGKQVSSVSEIIPNREISRKVNDIGLALSTGMDIQVDDNEDITTIEGRAARYPMLINIFLNNMIIGSGNRGNPHIFWLDILAMYGIVGFLPLVLLLYKFMRAMIVNIKQPLRVYVVSSALLFITLGLMKAIAGSLMYIVPFFIVPAYFYNESHNKSVKLVLDEYSNHLSK
jgi:hypothetical protein